MYDIYLSSECPNTPSLRALQVEAGMRWRDNLHNRRIRPGFLGLSLPAEKAAELLESLNQAGGIGLVVPVAYRKPKITRDVAYLIVEKKISQKTRKLFPNYTFEAVVMLDEEAMWWKFGSISKQLIQEGRPPGIVTVWVDKLDGHVWTEVEKARLYGEEYSLELAANREPMQVLQLLSENLDCAQEATGVAAAKDPISLRLSPALAVSAARHRCPELVEKQFGVRPTVNLLFKITPYKKGYHSVYALIGRAVKILLEYEPGDAALTFDAADDALVLKRIAGELITSQDWRSWMSEYGGKEAIALFS